MMLSRSVFRSAWVRSVCASWECSLWWREVRSVRRSDVMVFRMRNKKILSPAPVRFRFRLCWTFRYESKDKTNLNLNQTQTIQLSLRYLPQLHFPPFKLAHHAHPR